MIPQLQLKMGFKHADCSWTRFSETPGGHKSWQPVLDSALYGKFLFSVSSARCTDPITLRA